MDVHLYLSFLPEALIASQLPPEQFGAYYAVGTRNRSRGQAIFVEVDPKLQSEHFPIASASARCVPHTDGSPKRSVYISIYRVLERLPLGALGPLYLVTDDGRVLGLEPSAGEPAPSGPLHLYQELCPVQLRVASKLEPRAFCRQLTDRSQPVWLPRVAFLDLLLNGLATDPRGGSAENLPYGEIEHLRDCLVELETTPEKQLKTVSRQLRRELIYRTIRTGAYIGDPERMIFYPFPSLKELEATRFEWLRSADTIAFEY